MIVKELFRFKEFNESRKRIFRIFSSPIDTYNFVLLFVVQKKQNSTLYLFVRIIAWKYREKFETLFASRAQQFYNPSLRIRQLFRTFRTDAQETGYVAIEKLILNLVCARLVNLYSIPQKYLNARSIERKLIFIC